MSIKSDSSIWVIVLSFFTMLIFTGCSTPALQKYIIDPATKNQGSYLNKCVDLGKYGKSKDDEYIILCTTTDSKLLLVWAKKSNLKKDAEHLDFIFYTGYYFNSNDKTDRKLKNLIIKRFSDSRIIKVDFFPSSSNNKDSILVFYIDNKNLNYLYRDEDKNPIPDEYFNKLSLLIEVISVVTDKIFEPYPGKPRTKGINEKPDEHRRNNSDLEDILKKRNKRR